MRAHRFFRRWWRLFFNVFSAVTVFPLVVLTYLADGPYVFRWPSWAWPLRLSLLALSLYLFWAAMKVYGFWEFLGLRPERETLVRRGILARLRHPLYTAGLILLWIRDQTACWFCTDVILTLYIFLGTFLEERKLIRRFGEDYLRYRREVPPFWPRLRLR